MRKRWKRCGRIKFKHDALRRRDEPLRSRLVTENGQPPDGFTDHGNPVFSLQR